MREALRTTLITSEETSTGIALKILLITLLLDLNVGKVRLSLHTSQVAHQAGAYPGFHSMKRLGIFLLPPGWDASPSQGYPQH